MNIFVFCFRLSRVENAFGIMASTWRILLIRIHADPENINNNNKLPMRLEKSPDNCTENCSDSDCSDSDCSDSEDEDATIPVVATPSKAYDIREIIADWCNVTEVRKSLIHSAPICFVICRKRTQQTGVLDYFFFCVLAVEICARSNISNISEYRLKVFLVFRRYR